MKTSLVDKLKDFFVLHVEKLVLALAIALVGVFVWNGKSQKAYEELPDQLVKNVDSATNRINTGTQWEDLLAEENRDPERDFLADARMGRLPTKEAPYTMPVPLSPITRRAVVKRRDPALFPVTDIEVSAILGPLAEKKRGNSVDLLSSLPDAGPRPEDKPRRKRRSKDEDDADAGGASTPPGARSGRRGNEDGAGAGGALGLGGGPGLAGGGGSGSDASAEPETRVLAEPYGDYHPGAGGVSSFTGGGRFMMGPGAGGLAPSRPSSSNDDDDDDATSASTQEEAVARGGVIVAVNALVPFKKQSDEYAAALEHTYGWDPRLDSLNYFGFTVERADVTDDPSGEPQWDPQTKWNSWSLQESFKERFGDRQGPEQADPAYLLTGSLTLPVPPMMWRKLESISVHSKIPRMVTLPQETPRERPKSGDNESDGRFPPDLTALDRGPQTGGMGYGGGTGMMPGAPVGSPGAPGLIGGGGDSRFAMGGAAGGGQSAPRSGKGGGAGGGMMGPGMAGGMMGPGMGGGMMGGMMGGMYGGAGRSFSQVSEHKLLRFFDLTARPGRKYRYRVQLLVFDPNHPKIHEVNERGLAPEVIARLQQVAEEEARENRAAIYWRTTDWSEPSPVIAVPQVQRIYVGSPEGFDAVSTVQTTTGIDLPVKLPTTEAVGVVWDNKYAADVPLVAKAEPGRVLDQRQATLEVAHPINLTIHKLEPYDFRTQLTVVDLRGGELVGGDREDPLYAPTVALVMNGVGDLSIQNELDDFELYRVFTYENEKDSTTGGAMGAGGGMLGPSGDPSAGGGAPPSMPTMGGGPPSKRGGGGKRGGR